MGTLPDGKHGEDIACQYLSKNGYKILERNYRIRGGEIDIVAKEGEYLVFVEVKTRWSHKYGLPFESMTAWKIKYLLKTAKFYIQDINWGDKPYRLDFISIDYANSPASRGEPAEPKIELIKNITM